MKICLRCGKESKNSVDYCPDCGRPIYKEKPVEAPIPEPNETIGIMKDPTTEK